MMHRPRSRRTFLLNGLLAAGGILSGSAAIQLLGSTRAWAADFSNDADILNYALTLEYLEASFYDQGTKTGVLTAKSDMDAFALIAQDEQVHVQTLADAVRKIGGTPVAAPPITFPQGTFQSRDTFVGLARTFEETAVSAYLGAAASIQSNAVLQASAAIYGVEARHAGIVGYLAGAQPEGGIYPGAAEQPKSRDEVLRTLVPYMGSMPSTGFAPPA